ncbi:hypothetical protein ACFVXQ_26080 [Kitasatospora sp. NPDC058263]
MEDGEADAVHELRSAFLDEPDLRGRVAWTRNAPPADGIMGLAAEALLVLLAPGGVAAVLAGAVVAWVQSRRTSHTVTITRVDGTSISVSTAQVRPLDAEQLNVLVREVAAVAAPPDRLAASDRPDEPHV